ncbi:hypothetical protein Egran_05923 [Elaphomyces granulatus]|uniref:EXPERA domain-containing protein n=1 Tax=Elaphomyces granulatus TaxID=519963 RepID=A0A232LQA0_9EURO|nr:hypothetical protein Egran_05923 [Elaphomyces granulatus]
MDSTRQHPLEFSPASSASSANASVQSSSSTTSSPNRKWMHTPSAAVTSWLIVAIPVVLWDAGFVLLRPHSLPGGKLHSPIWTPYALYVTVDYIYGWPAFNARNGFTAAQAVLNLVETAGYVYYLFVVSRYAVTSTTAASRPSHKKGRRGLLWFLFDDKVVAGGIGAAALLVAFGAAVMTLSKTVLYLLNEVFSGFHNVGHNSAGTLVVYWILPNGLWIIFPGYMVYVFGSEILAALQAATPLAKGGRMKSL